MRAVLGTVLLMAAVRGLSGAPGEFKWELVVNHSIRGAPALATNNDLLIGAGNGALYAVSPEGAVRWTFATPEVILGAPLVGPDGTIYFGSDKLYALNPDGSQRWAFGAAGNRFLSTPALGPDGAVYFTSSREERLYAVNPDGTVRWAAAGKFTSAPVVAADGSLVAPMAYGTVGGVSPDGVIQFGRNIGNAVYAAAALATNGTIYVGVSGSTVREGALQALEPDGRPRWRFEGGAQTLGEAIVGPDGAVYYGFDSGRLVALEPTGQLRWEYLVEGEPAPNRIPFTPALASDGTLYFGGAQWLHALDTNGVLRWRYAADWPVGSPLIGPDGSVYFGAGNNRLVAIEGTGAGLAAGQWPMSRRDASHGASIADPPARPAAPTGLAASLDLHTDRVALQWSSVPGAIGYDIWRGATPELAEASLLAGGVTGRTYDDRTASPGQSHFYFVLARNAAGPGPAAGPVEGRRRVAGPGEPVWIYPAEAGSGTVTEGPDETVYFAGSDGRLYALDPAGRLKWRFPFGGRRATAPSIGADGTIYCVAGRRTNPFNHQDEDYAVFALHPDGSLRWVAPLPGAMAGGVAIGTEGTVYVVAAADAPFPGMQAAVLALAADGTCRWSYQSGRPFAATPVIGFDGTLYVATLDGWIQAIRPDGTALWECDCVDGYLRDPVIAENGVLFTSGAAYHAVNPDGTHLRSYPLLAGSDAGPSCVGPDGFVYGQGDSGIYRIQADGTNAVKLALPAPGDRTFAAVVLDAEGRRYVSARSGIYSDMLTGKIYALSSGGAKEWEYSLYRVTFGSPTLGRRNVVYLPGSDGRVYAMRTAGGPGSGAWPHPLHDAQRTARATLPPPAPAAPTESSATERTRVTEVRVSWPVVVGAAGYQVHRSTNNLVAHAELLGEVTGRRFFDDRRAVPEQTYTYWVRATNIAGLSDFSPPATGIRRQAVPGEALDSWNLGGLVTTSPAIGEDLTLYVAAGTRVVALHPEQGLLWEHPTSAAALSSPSLAADGTVYVGTRSSQFGEPAPASVIALHPDGTRDWEFLTTGGIEATPAIGVDGSLYVGTGGGNLHALSAAGELLWTYAAASPIEASAVIGGDGAIYVAARDGSLHAVQPDGARRWKLEVGLVAHAGRRMPSPALGADGTVYLATGSELVAVNMDGTIRWTTAMNVYASPVVSGDGSVIVGGADRAVHAVGPTGTELWHNTYASFLYQAGALSAAGVAYLPTEAGRLEAIALDGADLWHADLGAASYSAPVIGPDGTVFVCTSNGVLRSFCGAGALAATPWPMFQHDPRHTGRSLNGTGPLAAVGAVTASDGEFNDHVRVTWSSVPQAWFYELWRTNASDPDAGVCLASNLTAQRTFNDYTAAEGVAYLYSVRAGNSTGRGEFSLPDPGQRWAAVPGEILEAFQFAAAAGLSSAVAMDTNGLYVSGPHSRLHALRPDFSERWFYNLGVGESYSTPVIAADGTVYVAGGDQTVRALNPDGSVRWQTPNIGSSAALPPAVAADGTVYVGSQLRRLYAFNPDGVELWCLLLPGRVTTASAIGLDGGIYFGCDDDHFHAVNPDGTLRWRLGAGGALRSHPAIGPDGTVYFGCADGNVYAVTPEGATKWSLAVNGAVPGPPVIGPDGTIFVGALDGHLYAISPAGTLRWQYLPDGLLAGGAAVGADGTVYFGTARRSIYAVGPDGQLLWRTANVGLTTGGLLLLPDRTLVSPTYDGPLVALRAAQGPADSHWPTLHGGARRTGCARPWVTLLAEGGLESWHAGETVTLQPEWLLPNGAIRGAELLAGTRVVAASTQPPFGLSWPNISAGTHQVHVRVTDDAGCVHRSGSLTVVATPATLRGEFESSGAIRLHLQGLPARSYLLLTSTNQVHWEPAAVPASTEESHLSWRVEPNSAPNVLRAFRVKISRSPD